MFQIVITEPEGSFSYLPKSVTLPYLKQTNRIDFNIIIGCASWSLMFPPFKTLWLQCCIQFSPLPHYPCALPIKYPLILSYLQYIVNCEISLKPFILKIFLPVYYCLPFMYKYFSLILCHQTPFSYIFLLRAISTFSLVLMGGRVFNKALH
jgi:hypothetical protein